MLWLIGNCGILGNDVEKLLRAKKVPFIASDKEIDIGDRQALRDFIKNKDLSTVINCAAYTAVDQAENEEQEAFRINADGVLNLAELVRERDAKLIQVSTDYVFDGTKEGAYTESDSVNPINVYGRSKARGEENIINDLSKYLIIRTAWLYGANGSNFVRTMLRLFQERDEIRVVSDQFGSPTYSKDLAEVLIQISPSEKYGIYHYTNEGRITWHEFACEIYRLAKKYGKVKKDVKIVPVGTAEYPTMAARPKNTFLSKEKITRVFDINIKDWKTSLDRFMSEI